MSHEETLDGQALPNDWRPRSLRSAKPAWPAPRARAGILAAVLLGHVGIGLWLPWLDRDRLSAGEPDALLVDFIEVPPILESPPFEDVEGGAAVAPARRTLRIAPSRNRPRPEQPLQVSNMRVPTQAPLELYGSDGRVKLPTDLLAQIDSKYGETRNFDYQIPGMERAEKLLNRPSPITFERTRFDRHWKPDQDLVTEVLAKMVEKSVLEVRVPVPGEPTSKLVCQLVVLAMAGGCGMVTTGSDYIGPVDDPDTLSPEEDRQCQAWWEKIVGATTQEVWRNTRKLYESQCRKPLERISAE